MSFRLKTMLGIAAIEAVMLLILIWSSLLFLRASNEEELIKRADTTATLFATITKDAVLSTDLALLDAFVKEVLKNPGIVYARVISTEGVLAQGGRQDALERKFKTDLQFDSVEDGVFDTYAEIEEAGIGFGRVELGISISEIQSVLAEARQYISSIAIVEMVLTSLFSLVLGAVLTSRILTLKQVSERVAGGDLSSRVPVKGKDEIAIVSSAFNGMLDKLDVSAKMQRQYQGELEALNAKLEGRVTARTAQLESANDTLKHTMGALEAEKQEQLRLIEELRQTQSQLLQSEKMASMGQLAAGVAHEINNPVGYVISNIATLKRYVTDILKLLDRYEDMESRITDKEHSDSLQAFKEEIDLGFIRDDIQMLISESQDGTDRVKRIVQDLKDFSHVGESDWQWANLHDGLDSTLNIVCNEIKYKADIVKEYGELPDVECLASQLNQVFMNLLLNAAQAIEDRGTIKIHTAINEKNQVIIEFSDTGEGISKIHLNRIFDPFFTTKPVGSGTGLGLSLSYGIIKKHKGEIGVQSVEGEGTTFTITLPVKQ